MVDISGDLGQILERIQPLRPEVLKVLLWRVFLFLGTLDVGLFAGTVVHRLYVDYKDKRYRRAYDFFTDKVVEAIFGEEDVPNPKSDIEKEALVDVLVEINRKFRGETEEKVKEIAKKTGVVEFLIKRTKSFSLRKRILAFEKLAFLGVKEVKGSLRKSLEKEEKSWVIRRLALAYSLLIEDVSEIKFLFSKLSTIEDTSFKFLEFLWFNLLTNFHKRDKFEDLLGFVRNLFRERKLKPELLRSFVEALGNFKHPEGADLIREIYEGFKEDTLMRISCLRALGLTAYEGFCELFLENVEHPDWRVRAVVCKFAFLCPWEEVKGPLVERLYDKSYYVRINAGNSLLFFKSNVKPVLEELLQSEDKFVRDTARYLLQELELQHA